MYPRTEYEMTQEDLDAILSACKPTPCIMVGTYVPRTPQENANTAWQALGQKMGFDYMTVRPIESKGQRFFTAVPSETEGQRETRIKREGEEQRLEDIVRIEGEIAALVAKRDALSGKPKGERNESATEGDSRMGKAKGLVGEP